MITLSNDIYCFHTTWPDVKTPIFTEMRVCEYIIEMTNFVQSALYKLYLLWDYRF